MYSQTSTVLRVDSRHTGAYQIKIQHSIVEFLIFFFKVPVIFFHPKCLIANLVKKSYPILYHINNETNWKRTHRGSVGEGLSVQADGILVQPKLGKHLKSKSHKSKDLSNRIHILLKSQHSKKFQSDDHNK